MLRSRVEIGSNADIIHKQLKINYLQNSSAVNRCFKAWVNGRTVFLTTNNQRIRIKGAVNLLLRHRSADKIKNFGGDFLLATFVVGQGELSNEVLGIV